MYMTFSTIGKANVTAGDPMVVKFDRNFGRVGVYDVLGELHGYLKDEQPDGCVDEWTVYTQIGDNRVLGRVAVIMDGVIILQTDTKVFGLEYDFVPSSGYGCGMLVRRAYNKSV